MAMRRYMAIHTFHSEETKKAMMKWAAEIKQHRENLWPAKFLTNVALSRHGLEMMNSFLSLACGK